MANINGQMLICDRCGATAFRKCIGEGERDGGFTRWNKFEPKPEGWGWHPETGDICPACEKEFSKILEDFKRSVGKFNGNDTGSP